MSYLNVLAPSSIPVPNVRGLGAPRLVHPRGFGQAAMTCAQYIAQQLASLPPVNVAAMLLNTPSPSGVLADLYINGATSPQEAAQVVYQWAQEFCGQQADTVTFGGTPPADCADNGNAAAAAAYPAALAYYSALPQSVWTTGTVSAAVANPQVFISDPMFNPATGQRTNGNPVLPGSNTDPIPLGLVSSSPTEGGVTPNWAQNPAPPPPTTPPAPTPAQPGGPVQPPTLQLPSFLTNDISLFGFDVPVWGLAAAAFAVVFLMPKGRG